MVSHLGREATRAEIEAAAASGHLLERRGLVMVVHMAVLAAG